MWVSAYSNDERTIHENHERENQPTDREALSETPDALVDSNDHRRACGCERRSHPFVRRTGQQLQKHAGDVDDGRVPAVVAAVVRIPDATALARAVGRP